MSDDLYEPGSKGGFWRIDDRTGFRARARDTRQEWDGTIVDKTDFAERHPQDFVRGRRDKQSVPKPRPEPPDTMIGPAETTLAASASAGATSLEVTSSTGFHSTGRVAVMLDSGDRFLGTISAIPDATHLTLSAGLPGAAASGNLVVDYTAPAAPSL